MPLPVLNPAVAAWEPCGYARHAELIPGSRKSREEQAKAAEEARGRKKPPPRPDNGKWEWVFAHCDGELGSKGRRAHLWFWDSVYGKHICGFCHPPAHDCLVLDEVREDVDLWLDTRPGVPETPPGIPLENKDLEVRS